MTAPHWEILLENHPYNARTLEETLVGGQAFRWFRDPEGAFWIGTWASHVAALRLREDGPLEAARLSRRTTLEAIRSYLGTDRIASLVSRLPCNADPVLESLRRKWGGLSLLRQPPGETLLAFICSSNKQILQIRAMLGTIGGRFGKPIPGTPFKTLPDWETLAAVSEAELRSCALGYRAAHVANAAAFLAENPGFLDAVDDLSLEDARQALQRLPGVGPKVADCVLLFGYGRAAAFPVDTWIEQILVERYPALGGWKRPQLATFARLHFGEAGGLAQQWFFAEARSQSGRATTGDHRMPRGGSAM